MLCVVICLASFSVQAFKGFTSGLVSRRTTSKDFALSWKPGDKLMYDEETNRFFEADSKEVAIAEEFFLIDEAGKPVLLTKEEKERIFLDSIQSFYFSGKNELTDEQFDRLRDDLTWEGSALVTLNRNETMFMNAMQAYNKGTPILDDKEFDTLKESLKEMNSKIAVQTEPKCYVDTGVCKVTWEPDTIRTTSLYVPAAILTTLLYVGVTFELPFIGDINPLILLAVGAPPISFATKAITEDFFFKDPFVARGPCPSCGQDNKIFFGNVVGIEGDMQESTSKCTNCKASMKILRSTLRVSTLSQ